MSARRSGGNVQLAVGAGPAPAESDGLDGGFVKIPEAAKFLSLSPASLYNLMDSGQLAYAKFGRARRIPLRALHAYAARNTVSAN